MNWMEGWWAYVFIAVAERGHVTRAAAFLGMSHSAASAALKAL